MRHAINSEIGVKSLPNNIRSVQQPARPAVQPAQLPWDRQKQSPFSQGLIWWTALLTPVSFMSPLSYFLPHPPDPPHRLWNSTSIQQDWSTEWVPSLCPSCHFDHQLWENITVCAWFKNIAPRLKSMTLFHTVSQGHAYSVSVLFSFLLVM